MTTQKKITIQVLAFGIIADILGKTNMSYESLELVSSFKTQLEIDYPALTKVSYRIAVNKKLINEDCALTDDTEIALLPPFSGG